MAFFFSFDGVDGVGKSTQIDLFCEWLSEQGHDVVLCRDPGSTPLGEHLRTTVLEASEMRIDRRAEMLLFMAARAQMVNEIIDPALAAGKTVVSDRFLLANVVYQGHAGGLDVGTLWSIGAVATGGTMPQLTFVMDMSPRVAAERLQRSLDRMESQGFEYLDKVRDGFLAESGRFPDRYRVINADQPVGSVHEEIRQAAKRLLDPT